MDWRMLLVVVLGYAWCRLFSPRAQLRTGAPAPDPWARLARAHGRRGIVLRRDRRDALWRLCPA